MARPKKFDADKLAKELEKYIALNEDPIVQEFCHEQKVSRDTLYRLAKENQTLSDNIKDLHSKQEVRTVRKAEAGEINATFAIFKLKQRCYGWTDKQEMEHSGELKTTINFVPASKVKK